MFLVLPHHFLLSCWSVCRLKKGSIRVKLSRKSLKWGSFRAPPLYCVSVLKVKVNLLQLENTTRIPVSVSSLVLWDIDSTFFFVCQELTEFKMTCSCIAQTVGSWYTEGLKNSTGLWRWTVELVHNNIYSKCSLCVFFQKRLFKIYQ